MSRSPRESEDPVVTDDARTESPDIVSSHPGARRSERRVLLACALVGLIGVIILVAIIANGTPGDALLARG